MSKKQFEALDLAIFSILAIVFEFINYYIKAEIGQNVYVFLSYTIVLTLIALYRWGLFGLVVGLCGGLAACVVSGQINLQYILIYSISYLSLIICWLYTKLIGYKKVKKNILLSLLYLIIGYLLVATSRSLIWMAYGENFISVFGQYFTLESMSFVISIFILLIARMKNGIFTNMNDYLVEQYELRTNPMKKLNELHEDPSYNPTAEVIDEKEFNDNNILEDGTLSQEDLDKLQAMYNKKEKDNL